MITIDVSPIAFLGIRWYGIMVALAVAVVIGWMAWQVKRGARLSYETIFTAALVAIPSGIIVSRLLHVIDLWGYYSQHPGQIIGASGLTIYGAILGATLGIWIYSRFSRFDFGYFADLVAPAVILAQAVGRVGCTLNGCCYGLETLVPWAVVYTDSACYAPLGTPLHPTQLYEIVYLLIIFGVVLLLRGHLKPSGSLFMVYLGLYSAWRLGIDFMREGTPLLFGLHQAQLIAIVVLLIIIPVLIVKTQWIKKE